MNLKRKGALNTPLSKLATGLRIGTYLSGAGVQKRSLPTPRAVLDITGGGQSEKTQEAQGQGGLGHGDRSKIFCLCTRFL